MFSGFLVCSEHSVVVRYDKLCTSSLNPFPAIHDKILFTFVIN